jgi:hypothetical protein
MITSKWVVGLVAALGVTALAAPSMAQQHPRGGPAAPTHYDARYSHNHAYPERGVVYGARPSGGIGVNYRGGRYWYGGGVWYGPGRGGWVVVGPPIGVFVPVLPPFYTTVWFGGLPYYYANDTYYAWRDSDQGYQVVDPPGVASATTEAPAADIFLYPRNGQSAEQQGTDRYECHRWAADQTGFDPTIASGGVASADASNKRADYFRAMGACLEGRGYSVK